MYLISTAYVCYVVVWYVNNYTKKQKKLHVTIYIVMYNYTVFETPKNKRIEGQRLGGTIKATLPESESMYSDS